MRFLISGLMLIATTLAAAGTEGIAWHEGSVEEAFELAEREDRPMFLYWGAVWCPPCNQIKKTIFTQREFIEKSKLFVPVYLDGDTESAQVWADELEVMGYPTMLVMSPGGQEVMRMPTGLQVEAFARVLDEALATMTPIGKVLEAAIDEPDPDAVPDRYYRLLAFYSWAQDKQVNLSDRDAEAQFRTLADKVPERLAVERSRLYLMWLETAIDLAEAEPGKGEKRYKLTKAKRREADRRIREVLTTPELIIANLDAVTYYSAEIISALHPKDNQARRELIDLWLETARQVEENESLSVDERLSALFPAIHIFQMQAGEGDEPGAELQQRVVARVDWADEAADDSYTRQAMLGGAGYMLRKVGLEDDARALYLAEIEKSESPYYFMSSLAAMAKRDGNPDEAISWMARAYETSNGRATRFQWGTRYLIGLMDLAPDDADTIRTESLRVFEELMGFDDAFAGRNQARINRLARKYSSWNTEGVHADEITSLRAAMLPTCDGLESSVLEGDESMQSRCRDFFNQLGEP